MTNAVLRVSALRNVNVVACPRLVGAARTSPINADAAANATLSGSVLMLDASAVSGLNGSLVMYSVRVALVDNEGVLAAVVRSNRVNVPLSMNGLEVLDGRVVCCAGCRVLRLQVARVGGRLDTAAAGCHVALEHLSRPVEVLLMGFALNVDRFQLGPSARLRTVLLNVAGRTFSAIERFFNVCCPVTRDDVVSLTEVFLSRPSVIRCRRLAARTVSVDRRLVRALLISIRMGALPEIRRSVALLVAVDGRMLAAPLVRITTDATRTLVKVDGHGDEDLRDFALLRVVF